MRPILFSFLTIVLFSGCNSSPKSQGEEPQCLVKCVSSPFTVGFGGYEPAELDSVLVTRYVADGFFNDVLSDTLYTLDDTTSYFNKGDLVTIGYRGFIMVPGVDYEVQVYATGQTFRVSDIKEAGTTQLYPCYAGNCPDPKTNSFSFSGGVQEIRRFDIAPIYFVLRK